METTKITELTIIGIIALAVSLTIAQFFLRNLQLKSAKEGKMNLSFGILFFSWVVCYSILNLRSITILYEYVDLIYKTSSDNPLYEVIKTSVIFIGLTNAWLIIWYYITQIFIPIITGKRVDIKEIESNNYTYYMMKGIVFISFVYCLLPVFELLLRTFLPKIEIPYYR